MTKNQDLTRDDESQIIQNWLVTGDGYVHPYQTNEPESSVNPYRLYRFLTDLEDIITNLTDEDRIIKAVSPLVRKLLTDSSWLQMEYIPPSPSQGWSVNMLYKEPNFPLTVQMVTWLPGNVSPIHNHATWGIVALISGEEKNTFWRCSPTPQSPNRIELVGEKILLPGDIIGFMPDTIHSVESIGDEPTISFNVYGITNFEERFEFDPLKHTATNF